VAKRDSPKRRKKAVRIEPKGEDWGKNWPEVAEQQKNKQDKGKHET